MITKAAIDLLSFEGQLQANTKALRVLKLLNTVGTEVEAEQPNSNKNKNKKKAVVNTNDN